jgi:hypothetical protein
VWRLSSGIILTAILDNVRAGDAQFCKVALLSIDRIG